MSGVDASVGEIVDHLAKRGELDNTLIMFTSDNGFMFGEHGLAGKWWMFEELIRVPLLVCPPRAVGAPVGRLVHAVTLNVDLQPTLLAAFGKPVPTATQGKSFWPVIEGTADGVRDEFYYEHFFDHPTISKSEGVRTKEWKYIAWPGQHEHEEMLFNLIEDPQEETDLAGDLHYAERKAQLRQRMLTLKHDLDPGPAPPSRLSAARIEHENIRAEVQIHQRRRDELACRGHAEGEAVEHPVQVALLTVDSSENAGVQKVGSRHRAGSRNRNARAPRLPAPTRGVRQGPRVAPW